jgi:hypothetical protein
MKTNRQRRLSSGAQGGPLGKKCAALVNSGKIWFMITFLIRIRLYLVIITKKSKRFKYKLKNIGLGSVGASYES